MKIRTKEEAIAFRKQIEAAALNLDDKGASMSADFYNGMTYNGELIAAGTRINHNGELFKAAVDLWDKEENNPDNAPNLWEEIQYHNGILYKAAVDLWGTEANNPENAPTLWEEIQYHEGIRIIPEVITVTTAFAKDELGYWKADGKTYKSLLDANVYTPVAYPQGWEEV